ncbi:hypothetical protein MKZ38_004787 [Zalerion maritima]|uniref:Uncharacterized protein n=1 Tax=Zalerion maritima TaxID=339359 RepID=A0AAD5RM81_9PEZI|nr:hypothetical protein MKZ38_004787 [Zalerion maritima]
MMAHNIAFILNQGLGLLPLIALCFYLFKFPMITNLYIISLAFMPAVTSHWGLLDWLEDWRVSLHAGFKYAADTKAQRQNSRKWRHNRLLGHNEIAEKDWGRPRRTGTNNEPRVKIDSIPIDETTEHNAEPHPSVDAKSTKTSAPHVHFEQDGSTRPGNKIEKAASRSEYPNPTHSEDNTVIHTLREAWNPGENFSIPSTNKLTPSSPEFPRSPRQAHQESWFLFSSSPLPKRNPVSKNNDTSQSRGREQSTPSHRNCVGSIPCSNTTRAGREVWRGQPTSRPPSRGSAGSWDTSNALPSHHQHQELTNSYNGGSLNSNDSVKSSTTANGSGRSGRANSNAGLDWGGLPRQAEMQQRGRDSWR